MNTETKYEETLKERETVLLTPTQKKILEAAHKKLGVSKGEIIRHATFELYLKKIEAKTGPLR